MTIGENGPGIGNWSKILKDDAGWRREECCLEARGHEEPSSRECLQRAERAGGAWDGGIVESGGVALAL